MKITVSCDLSRGALNGVFVRTGNLPYRTQDIEIDLVTATPEQRQVLLAYDLTAASKSKVELCDYSNPRPEVVGHAPHIVFDIEPTAEQVLAALVEQAPLKVAFDAVQAEIKREREAAAAKREAERQALIARIKADDEARAAAVAAQRAQLEAEKAAWVAEHGSSQLQRACARGHDCQRLYVVERAKREAPGYVVDFQNVAVWQDRSCPSAAALDEADSAEALNIGEVKIVWLTRPARWRTDEVDPYEFDPREAVVIRKYLTKYDLVKVL